MIMAIDMTQWHKTGCVLCAQNCGLEVRVVNNRMVKVRPDKNNPRSRGYACRKGLKIAFHQHHANRLTHPLKRTASGFKKISWARAIGEISDKLKSIVDRYGPRAYAYMGGGGQSCHFEAAFGRTLMKLIGSQYHDNAVAQERTGYFWACGRHTGRQNDYHIPDEHRADTLLAVGWNGMESHQMPRAPRVLKAFSKNPDKLLVVIDPRRTKTARIADIHLPVRPGSDALMVRAMIAILLQNGWEDRQYIDQYTTGFNRIRPWFEDVAAEGRWLGKSDPQNNMAAIRTPSGKTERHISEMDAWMADLTPEKEALALAPDPEFPHVLMAGRHIRTNANTLMRNPAWNRGQHACTLAMHATDALRLELKDDQMVTVVTAAGEETVALEISAAARIGHVAMPHGFGLDYQGTVSGANVNRLTQNTHRDILAATPLHRYVPCRVEAGSGPPGSGR